MKKIIAKSVIVLFFVMICSAISQSVSPLVGNSLAMNQMNNSMDSHIGIQLYSYFQNYSWIVIILFALLLFKKEIKTVITKIKETMKNEEE